MSNELPIVEKKQGCGCDHEHEAEVPTLVAGEIPHAIRHGAILGALGQVAPGGQMDLVAPHVPTPLLAQVEEVFGSAVGYEVVDPTPSAYRIRFTKHSALDA